MTDILKTWQSGYIRRFHTTPHAVPQEIGTHAWGVAVLITLLHPNPRAELLKYALLHDTGEYCTGDVPSIAKWASPEVKKELDKLEERFLRGVLQLELPELDVYDKVWLKQCDMLDMTIYTYDHRTNPYMKNIWLRCRDWWGARYNDRTILLQVDNFFNLYPFLRHTGLEPQIEIYEGGLL